MIWSVWKCCLIQGTCPAAACRGGWSRSPGINPNFIFICLVILVKIYRLAAVFKNNLPSILLACTLFYENIDNHHSQVGGCFMLMIGLELGFGSFTFWPIFTLIVISYLWSLFYDICPGWAGSKSAAPPSAEAGKKAKRRWKKIKSANCYELCLILCTDF